VWSQGSSSKGRSQPDGYLVGLGAGGHRYRPTPRATPFEIPCWNRHQRTSTPRDPTNRRDRGTQPIAQCEENWLVGQIPLQIRGDLVLPHDAKGIDGVYRTKHDSLVPYQVKFRSKRAYLTFTELAGFIGVTDRATERVIFTNSNELADDIRRRPGLRVVRGIDSDRLKPADFQVIEAWLKEKRIRKPKITPRDYQEAALRDTSACVSDNDRAHVVMACGTGKTLVALWSAEQVGARQILVLLPSLSLLRQTLQEWSTHNSWGDDYSYICVCSDPTVSRQSD
jgi:predicted helicase